MTMRMTKRQLMAIGLGGAAALAGPRRSLRAQSAYPDRPISLIVPWGAGGGTDSTARIVAAVLEKDLGQPINVINRPGGNGVVGHTAVATAEPDGYTLGMITTEVNMMHWQGVADLGPGSFTPVALINEDPPGVQVNAASPWTTIQELADHIKANPGALKASGTSRGGIWHLALAGWLDAMGVPPDSVRWVPSNGSAPALQDLAAGGVDIVTTSVPEARSLIDAGKVRSLAIMAAQRNPQFPDVPTLKETLGVEFTTGAWRGIAGPKDLPQPVVDRLVAGLTGVMGSAEFKDFMNARGFGIRWADQAGFAAFLAETDRSMGETMRAAGLI